MKRTHKNYDVIWKGISGYLLKETETQCMLLNNSGPVGVDDSPPMILWCKYFTKAQGYTVEHNILYQDKKLTILLAKNGRMPISNRTKHIKGRCFLVKDKIDNNELEAKHRSTEVM